MNNITKTIKESVELAGKDFWPASLAKVKSHLLQSQIRLLDAILPEIERIKLDMDVVVCDCGEPYKGTDPSDLVEKLISSLEEVKKELLK